MCVAITMEPGTDLSKEEIFKMGRANADGVGVAWADGGVVHWAKTINYTPDTLYNFIKEREGYFRLVHFRLSTVGGVRADLCHPFEVGPMANPHWTGHSSRVLIHNGHWHRWTDIIDILKKEEALPDMGPWSDSRLMAYLASFDEDWLHVVTGRVAMMDGDGNTVRIGDWSDLRAGIKVSNKHWDHTYNYRRSGRDRDWPGWGWSEKEWEEAEAHSKEKEKEKEKNEQEGKESAKTAQGGTATGGKGGKGQTQGQGQKAGSVHVGGGPPHGGSRVSTSGTGGSGAGYRSIGPNGYGAKIDGEESKVAVQQETVSYDHAPWQNPVTKRWYYIPPESCSGIHYRIDEISEDKARSLMESAATSVHGRFRQ
jgi:hypothetical protein